MCVPGPRYNQLMSFAEIPEWAQFGCDFGGAFPTYAEKITCEIASTNQQLASTHSVARFDNNTWTGLERDEDGHLVALPRSRSHTGEGIGRATLS